MDRNDVASHAALAACTAVYAVYLDSLESRYHPNGTYFTVVAGVALTGGGVALRIALGVPDETPRRVAWWVWQQCAGHFVTSGGVIGAWQLWQHLRLERERRDGTARTRGGRSTRRTD